MKILKIASLLIMLIFAISACEFKVIPPPIVVQQYPEFVNPYIVPLPLFIYPIFIPIHHHHYWNSPYSYPHRHYHQHW